MFQNYNKYLHPQQNKQYDFQPRELNQTRQFHVQPLPQLYHFNQQPEQSFYHQSFPQQNYHQSLPQQYSYQQLPQNKCFGIAPTNSIYTPQNYYLFPNDDKQYEINKYPKVNLQKSKQIQQSSYQQSETEIDYIEFFRHKEFNQKQQQQIDVQDFQDFQEFRKYMQEQQLRQRVEQEEEKRQLTNFYRWKHRQVYSEKEYKSQLEKKKDIQQCYSKLILEDPNMEINQEISTLMRPNIGINKDY